MKVKDRHGRTRYHRQTLTPAEKAAVAAGGCLLMLFGLVAWVVKIVVIIYALLTILWYCNVRIDQFTPFWE